MRGVDGFVKERLSQVLAARGLTQGQLASMVGVSPSTVSKWRSGQQAPERDALERLASVVNVRPEWFTRPLGSSTSPPLFRSNASAHVAARQKLEARIQWAQDIAVTLSQFVDFPELNLPVREFIDPYQIDDADIEDAANECRDYWRLGRGPIPDLALAAEGAGIIVIREETGTSKIEGLSAWSESLGRPLVLLSSDKDNGFRSRFDLAHEIGHLILHKNVPKATERDRYKEVERQAHRFAGAFLLPAASFAEQVRTPVTLDGLLLLKQRWGVSVAALIKRLEALKIITEEEVVSLYKRRSARWGGAKVEPGDGSRPPEHPRLLRRTIDLLVSNAVMPLSSIPDYFGLSPMDVEMLAGLPEGYFRGPADVVDLARLRTSAPSSAKTNSVSAQVIPFSKRR
jgi:Zn-dependent peptidase ImmA (M78 family)/DNA-binding XRE family transcriptional regulator